MGLIEGYCLFALATAITAAIELFWPVLASLAITHPELQTVEYKWTTMLVFVLMALVMAPVTILPCVIPRMGVRFRKTLWESLIKS